MSAFIVLGAQWGDEGKGKMTDYLAEEANVVLIEYLMVNEKKRRCSHVINRSRWDAMGRRR